MLNIILIVLCVVYNVSGDLELGSPCPVMNGTGTCKKIHSCSYAMKLVDEKKSPDLCFYDNEPPFDPVVCCPEKNRIVFHTTGVLRQYFDATEDGVRKSKDINCRYDGKMPMSCCKNTPSYPIDSRLTGCSSIEDPTFQTPLVHTPAEKIAWNNCLEYRKLLYKCVASANNSDTLQRTNLCDSDMFGFRIFHGIEAQPKQFPHMAVLGCHNGDERYRVDIAWIGGGSLISDKFILTAAHVLYDPTHKLVKYALLGTLNKKDTRNGALYTVIRRIPHPDYNTNTKWNDIALVELDRHVKLSEFIRPICLPVSGVETESQQKIAGWGLTEKGDTSDVLMTINASSQDDELCTSKLNAEKTFTFNPNTMLCYTGETEGGDSCRGDSGGPLMSKVINVTLECTYFLTGVVSYGPECGKGAPAAYTKVSAYMDWIVTTVWPKEYSQISKI